MLTETATPVAVAAATGESAANETTTDDLDIATLRAAVLELRGFVRRAPHPTDGRQILVTRTEAGDAFVQASRQVRSAWLRERIDQLEPADRQALAAATEAFSRMAAMP